MWRPFFSFARKSYFKYDQIYARWPKLTAGITMGGAAGACDVLAQKIEKPSLRLQNVDVLRVFHFSMYNGIFCGAFLQVVYNVYYPAMFTGTVLMKAVKVTIFDNFVFGPLLYLPSYYVYKSLADGRTSLAGLHDYLENGWDVVKGLILLWVPTQLGIFVFVPPNFRILIHAVVGCVWDVVLSYLAPMETDIVSDCNDVVALQQSAGGISGSNDEGNGTSASATVVQTHPRNQRTTEIILKTTSED